MNAHDNPLLDFSGLPRFDAIRPAHVTPAMDVLVADVRRAVEGVATASGEPTWDAVVAPMASALDRLDRAWGAVRHLNAVVDTPELRDAHNASLPHVVALFTDIAQDLRLYGKYRALHASPAYAALDAAQRKVVDNELRDFRLGGAELPDAQKARFKALQEELADLSTQFSEHVLDATNAWAYYASAEELAGVPADVVDAARAAAQAEGKDGHKLTLRMPCYLPVMQYAHRRELRARLHRAFATRASDLGERPEWDNGPLIGRILAGRREEAELLGYPNYAHVSLVPKMAEHPDEVVAFLRDLAQRAKPFADNDFAELTAFAQAHLDLGALEP